MNGYGCASRKVALRLANAAYQGHSVSLRSVKTTAECQSASPASSAPGRLATQSVPTPGTDAAGTQRVAALVTAEAQRGVDSFRSSGPPIYTMRSDPKAAESHSKGANFLITNSFEPSSAWSSHVHVVTTVWCGRAGRVSIAAGVTVAALV